MQPANHSVTTTAASDEVPYPTQEVSQFLQRFLATGASQGARAIDEVVGRPSGTGGHLARRVQGSIRV